MTPQNQRASLYYRYQPPFFFRLACRTRCKTEDRQTPPPHCRAVDHYDSPHSRGVWRHTRCVKESNGNGTHTACALAHTRTQSLAYEARGGGGTRPDSGRSGLVHGGYGSLVHGGPPARRRARQGAQRCKPMTARGAPSDRHLPVGRCRARAWAWGAQKSRGLFLPP